MPKLISVKRSSQEGKKWVAEFRMDDGRTKHTHFGASGYLDYTTGNTSERRAEYLRRHEKDLETHDPTRAGFLSYYILWGPSTSMEQNIHAYKHRFHV